MAIMISSISYATARRDACHAYDPEKAPAALLALLSIDYVVADFLIEAYADGYAEVKGLDIADWSGEHAAEALNATPLDDQGWSAPERRTWAMVYDAIVQAYRAV